MAFPKRTIFDVWCSDPFYRVEVIPESRDPFSLLCN
jgi:hypothetical protein